MKQREAKTLNYRIRILSGSPSLKSAHTYTDGEWAQQLPHSHFFHSSLPIRLLLHAKNNITASATTLLAVRNNSALTAMRKKVKSNFLVFFFFIFIPFFCSRKGKKIWFLSLKRLTSRRSRAGKKKSFSSSHSPMIWPFAGRIN